MLKIIQYLLVAFLSQCMVGNCRSRQCKRVDTIDFKTTDAFRLQPFYFSFIPKTVENQLLDNVCATFFPLPDNPGSNKIFISRVYCDGSTDIQTVIETQVGLGISKKGSPFTTFTDYHIGYAGCDTNILYRCSDFGEYFDPYVLGLTNIYRPIGLSCLRKVEEIIRGHGLEPDAYYVLPMKLPNRCVTQDVCTLPLNPFYNTLASPAVAYL